MTRTGEWRRLRLANARLYLCTDLRLDRGDLEPFLDRVLAAGVDIVQMREKDAPPDVMELGGEVFRDAAHRYGALFIVNDDPELAVEVGADGVHVGQEDPPPREARTHVGPDRLVGRSTHDHGQIARALKEDCDYFAVGPVHATPTKEGRPGIGLMPIRLAASMDTDKPWFVTGGMAPDTAPAVLEAGASRIVVVRAIYDADDPAAATRELTDVVAS